VKLSLLNKRIGIKIGSLVYYISKIDGKKCYCIVVEIKNGKVYGNWRNSIIKAKNSNSLYTGYMWIERCFNEIE